MLRAFLAVCFDRVWALLVTFNTWEYRFIPFRYQQDAFINRKVKENRKRSRLTKAFSSNSATILQSFKADANSRNQVERQSSELVKPISSLLNQVRIEIFIYVVGSADTKRIIAFRYALQGVVYMIRVHTFYRTRTTKKAMKKTK